MSAQHDDAEEKRLTLVHNEQVKITATFLNGIGLGCLAATVAIMGLSFGPLGGSPVVAFTGIAIFGSVAMGAHVGARSVLKDLR